MFQKLRTPLTDEQHRENDFGDRPQASFADGRSVERVRWALALTLFVTLGTSPAIGQNVPYSLPVELPPPLKSPATASDAPYSPAVRKLINQLLPGDRPTAAQIRAATSLITGQDGANPSCHNLANVVAPATQPAIMPLCFSDGLGINVLSGPNAGRTTAYPSTLALAASFNLRLANVLGQALGREGRALMVTGLLGPQADTDVFINWSRGHHTPGEDPFLNGRVVAAEVSGLQGAGLMAEVKHFAGYNGTADDHLAIIQDQAFHELLLPPYERALEEGGAGSIMCSYQLLRVEGRGLSGDAPALRETTFGRASTRTWPLDEAHYACEQPLLLNRVLRAQWRFKGFVGSDYGGVHSAAGFVQGDDREDPSHDFFGISDPGTIKSRAEGPARPKWANDVSGDTCTIGSGAATSCRTSGAIHVSGIPGPGCRINGCGVANAVINGSLPLPLLKQALARVLYQIERFRMLGCDNDHASCENPGGVNGDRSGTAALPAGPAKGPVVLGTRNGNAAIAEQIAEQGAVLLKNSTDGGSGLPIRPADLVRRVAVTGPGAEYLIANPNNEGATGFAERDAISPLLQLELLSGHPEAFTYTPANGPSGIPINCGHLSARLRRANASVSACGPQSGLLRSSAAIGEALARDGVDQSIDYTQGEKGTLPGGRLYRWEGWVYIDMADHITFRLQHSATIPDEKVHFVLDGTARTLTDAVSFYHGQYYGAQAVNVAITNAGYIEPGLRNRQCAAPPDSSKRGFGPPPADIAAAGALVTHSPVIVCEPVLAPGWHQIAIEVDARSIATRISVRFAWSRANGDIADAANAAVGKAMAIVFVDDEDRRSLLPFQIDDSTVSALRADRIALIQAVAAKNPNTIVVLNTGTPVIVSDWIDNPNIKAVLNMWHAGQEGGTATARLLLGHANPSGHTTITWPRLGTDTIQHYAQSKPLYPGDTAGSHPERANGGQAGTSRMTQGIFSGYRFYDALGLPVQFPFGYGLSYTRFTFCKLTATARSDGSVLIGFDVRNTGAIAGAAVAQVYVGAGPARRGIQQAVRALRGFERVELAPGEQRHLGILLDRRSFEYWDSVRQRWELNAGPRLVWVGDADAGDHLPLQTMISIVKRRSMQR